MTVLDEEYQAIAQQIGFTYYSKEMVLSGSLNGFRIAIYARNVRSPYTFLMQVAGKQEVRTDLRNAIKEFQKSVPAIRTISFGSHSLRIVLKAIRNQEKRIHVLQDVLDQLEYFLNANHFVACCQMTGQECSVRLYIVKGRFLFLSQESGNQVMTEAHQNMNRDNGQIMSIAGGFTGALIGFFVLFFALHLSQWFLVAIAAFLLPVFTFEGCRMVDPNMTKLSENIGTIILMVFALLALNLEMAFELANAFDCSVFSAFFDIFSALKNGMLIASSYFFALAFIYMFVTFGIGFSLRSANKVKVDLTSTYPIEEKEGESIE